MITNTISLVKIPNSIVFYRIYVSKLELGYEYDISIIGEFLYNKESYKVILRACHGSGNKNYVKFYKKGYYTDNEILTHITVGIDGVDIRADLIKFISEMLSDDDNYTINCKFRKLYNKYLDQFISLSDKGYIINVNLFDTSLLKDERLLSCIDINEYLDELLEIDVGNISRVIDKFSEYKNYDNIPLFLDCTKIHLLMDSIDKLKELGYDIVTEPSEEYYKEFDHNILGIKKYYTGILTINLKSTNKSDNKEE